MPRSILLIEDAPKERQLVCETLQDQGYSVSTISDPQQAWATVEQWAQQFHLVIIEEAMRGRTGLRLLQEARAKRKDLPVVIVTREGDWNGYARALSDGAVDYIPHPIDRRELLAAVEEALAQTV
jgi:DNA-binding response OmpR family regulator